MAALCWSPSAHAEDARVNIACSDWAPELRAQIEARIRASLLLDERGVRAMGVTCESTLIYVEAQSGDVALRRSVVRRGSLEDDVTAAVDQILDQLAPTNSASAAPVQKTAPASEQAEPPPSPLPVPRVPVVAVTPVASPLPARSLRVTQVEAGGLVERWSQSWAWGAHVGLLVGTPRLQYGLLLGGRAATGEPTTFELSEWSAAGRLQLVLHEAAALRAALSVGASAAVTVPTLGVVTDSKTLLVTPFAELCVSRPFWVGPFGIGPVLGIRLFGGEREVRVNGVRARALPLFAPQAGLVFSLALPSG